MRKTALDMIFALARKDQRVFFIGSDLGTGTMQEFKDEMPERFFMEGISEQNIVGMAAGLAMEGKIPYVNTIATFITRRCYEQNVIDIGLHNLNVRLIGNGGGFVYAPLGPTHQAIDDIAIMRVIPNMTVIVPADAGEMRRMMPLTVGHQGPIYIRLAKGYDPIVTNEKIPFEIGKALPVREGRDALMVTTGITLNIAIRASEILSAAGIETAILHVPTVKPMDVKTLLAFAKPVNAIVTLEEHTVMGGLGSAVAEIVVEAGFDDVKKFKRIGIPDVFAEGYGSQDELMEKYEITPDKTVSVIRGLLGK